MALIICKECGHEVSDKAKVCPNCGYPIYKNVPTDKSEDNITIISDRQKSRNMTSKLLWCLIAFVLYLTLGYIFSNLLLLREYSYLRSKDVVETSFTLYGFISFIIAMWAAKNYKRILSSFLITVCVCVLGCLMWKEYAAISIVANVIWLINCFILIWESNTLFYTQNRKFNFFKGIITLLIFFIIVWMCIFTRSSEKESDGCHRVDFIVYSEELENKAYSGDAIAQWELYVCYSRGDIGPAKNEEQALQFLVASANNGLPRSMIILGNLYKYGHLGIQQNKEEAAKWYKKASELGSEEAEFKLRELTK